MSLTIEELYRRAHSDGDLKTVEAIASIEEHVLEAHDVVTQDQLDDAMADAASAREDLDAANERIDEHCFVLDIIAAYCEGATDGLRKADLKALGEVLRAAEKDLPANAKERTAFEDRIEAIFDKKE